MVLKRRKETDTNCCTFIDKVKINGIKFGPIDTMKDYGGVEM